MDTEMKYEFELNDKIADEIIRQTLTRVQEYAIDEMSGRSTHEEDRAYYRSLSEALDIVLDYFREGE